MKTLHVLITLSLVFGPSCMADKEQVRAHIKLMGSQLEEILKNGEAINVRPAPLIQIQALQDQPEGLELLMGLDKVYSRLAFDPRTEEFLCVWNGPHDQVLFSHDGKSGGVTAGIPRQITLTSVELKNGEAALYYTASSDDKDQLTLDRFFGLESGQKYECKIKLVNLKKADFMKLFQSGKPVE